MRDARDIDDVTRHDIVFHQAVARTSGNTLVLQIARSFEPLMTIAVPLAWRTRDTDLARAEVLAVTATSPGLWPTAIPPPPPR